MRSLESARSRDLDQVDPEHLRRESHETGWDDLKNVQPHAAEDDPRKAFDEIMASLPADDKEQQLEQARADVMRTFAQMDEVGSFGKNARESAPEKPRTEPANDMSLEDLSKTF